ncbi:MAG: SAM-dependent methyltransferase [Wenzhouxiangellaceae bacterium]|nr:SAM-dependent methyltransferase [Wenzhouxiangellaceae bacterium]
MSDRSLNLPEPPAELADLSAQLCTRIVNAIAADGPMPFQRFMQMALYEPGLGYYVNGLYKFGAAGDFVTAPERGRLFAAGLAVELDRLGQNLEPEWTLLELGPGSGALARDLLEQLDAPPARYLMLEPSAVLRQVQAETLEALPQSLRRRVAWVDQPPEQSFDGAIVANEVIDALPISRFRKHATGFDELMVTVQSGRFGWSTRPAGGRLLKALVQLEADLAEPLASGYESEICVDLPEWLAAVTRPLGRGKVLVVDYGYPRREYYHPDRSAGTLVCHYRHRAHFDPFVWPGLTDLSAFVDFTAVAEAAQACALDVAGFTTQAGFLLASGVHERIEQAESDFERLKLASEFKQLILPGEMGEKFKVMALTRGAIDDTQAFDWSDQLGRL